MEKQDWIILVQDIIESHWIKFSERNPAIVWRDDARIGRLLSVDRFAEKYPSLSPYSYAAGNPVVIIDANGDNTWFILYSRIYPADFVKA